MIYTDGSLEEIIELKPPEEYREDYPEEMEYYPEYEVRNTGEETKLGFKFAVDQDSEVKVELKVVYGDGTVHQSEIYPNEREYMEEIKLIK